MLLVRAEEVRGARADRLFELVDEVEEEVAY